MNVALTSQVPSTTIDVKIVYRTLMACVSDLTQDTLYTLFSLVAELDEPTTRSLGWLRLTHVCRLWRMVGHSHSTLWARVYGSFASREALVAARARARKVPLKVTVPKGLTKKDEDILADNILRDFALIETLSVRRISRSWTQLVVQARHLPQLRQLIIDDNDTPEREAMSKRMSEVQQTGLSSERIYAPKLENLRLQGGRPIPFVAPALTTLVISKHVTTQWMLLDILYECSSLETITIDYIFVMPLPSIETHKTIELPCLRSFKLLLHPVFHGLLHREIQDFRRKIQLPAGAWRLRWPASSRSTARS
ncbi:unnamed protein product [Peniophora sp. CBMAI 1063]|nr:unnamed protein product [Peniophora sp. CBMAI 1063]